MIYLPFTNRKSVHNTNQNEKNRFVDMWIWRRRPRGGTPLSQEHRVESGQTRNRNEIEKEKYLKYNFVEAIIF